jgi:FkbM family methyltransferase
MSIFSRRVRPPSVRHAPAGEAFAGTLREAEVIAGFELLLGRKPVQGSEIAEALRLRDLGELVEYLIGSDEFRARYGLMAQPRSAPASKAATLGKPAPRFPGNRALGNAAISQLSQIELHLSELTRHLGTIGARLSRLEKLAHGGKAVYVGHGRILTKVSLGQWNIAYLLEANDLLFAPHLVVNGYHEIDVTDYFINNLGNNYHCLDVGANFGYYTCIMGRWAPQGKTIALEPDGRVFELLRDNVYINSLEGVTLPRHAAAADVEGTLTMHRRVTRSGNTSIVKMPDEALSGMGEPPSEAFDIACMPIDRLLPEFGGRVDCVKIDVEGAEPLVLRGARATIANNPQIKIVMEWSPSQLRDAGFDPSEFTADLAGLGLSPAAIATGGIGQSLTWDALLALSYHPGILLTRQPSC